MTYKVPLTHCLHSRRPREQFFSAADVVEAVFNDEEDPEGMSSGEESDLDRQLYDLNGDQR